MYINQWVMNFQALQSTENRMYPSSRPRGQLALILYCEKLFLSIQALLLRVHRQGLHDTVVNQR